MRGAALVFLLVEVALSNAHLHFHAPWLIDKSLWPQGFVGLDLPEETGRLVAGPLGGKLWTLDSSADTAHDSWKCVKSTSASLSMSQVFPSHCLITDTCKNVTTFGRCFPVLMSGQSATNFSCTGGNIFWSNEQAMLQTRPSGKNITFSGFPEPVISGHFSSGGIRFGGTGSVRLRTGALIQTVIVTFKQENFSYPDATSILVFRSVDAGSTWKYLSTLASAQQFPDSQEGPNEMDIILLPDGNTLYAVMRLDAGDGPISHPYVPYHQTISQDGGLTWRHPTPMPHGMGCARPRLLRIGNSVLLSGGRMRNLNTSDIILWVNHDVLGHASEWHEYSISYQHNLKIGLHYNNASLAFDSNVNSTTFAPRESNSYTSLVRLSETRTLLTYDMHKSGREYSFSMEIEVT